MTVCLCAQTIGLATCLRISTCFDYMFQNNSLLNNTTWACSFKIKRVILRGLKDICLSRRHETQSSGMFRPACGGCFGLGLLRPFLLLWLLRPLAASAFLGCIRPMEQKWQRLSETWQLDFPWLDIKQGPFRLGCQICHEAGVQSKWGMFSVASPNQMQRIAFQRHEKRPQHKEAASGKAVAFAPAANVFEKIVNDIQNGTATCSSRKNTQLTWCLAEALKAMDQVVLAKCEAISLFRDERHGRIAIRFRAVTKDLHVLSGFLGQEQFAGTGGRALTFATEHVTKRACSRFSGRHDSKQKSFLKKSLFQHFKSKLVSVTTDSAADEVLSSELMRTKMTGFREVLAPNLRWVVQDKAHGSRRITSRPWHSDEFLNEVLQFMAGGHASIARLVHYSPEIKRIFQQFANTSESTVLKTVSNFRAAQHRFDSQAKPLGRTCLFLHACVRTALHLTRARSDNMMRKAKNFLLWLNDERALQAAMLADAADTSLRLTRCMDAEDLDTAALQEEVASYRNEIRALFVEGKCWTTFGYTKSMCECLSTPIVFQVGSKLRSLGTAAGVDNDVRQRCLGRMRAWARLAESALDAEFPAFEIAQAFSVFDLRGTHRNPGECLERIAKSCHLDFQILFRQWQDVEPRASAEFTTLSSNKEAWKSVLHKLDQHHCTRKNHPTDVLTEALIQYFAFGGSSSGVEQNFSKAAWNFHCRRRAALPQTEEMALKVCLDFKNHDSTKVIMLARKVWALCFGQPRQRLKSRIDKGIKKPILVHTGQPKTEAAFLHMRREAAVSAGLNCKAGCLGLDDARPHWSEAHDAELLFQERKLNERRVQAYAENSLLTSEETPALQTAAETCKRKMVENELAREKKRRRLQDLSAQDVLPQLAGLRVYYRPDMVSANMAVSADQAASALADGLVNWSLRATRQALDAHAVICNCPGDIKDLRVRLLSAMLGWYEISSTLVVTGKGAILKMKRGAATKRVLVVSRQCAAQSKKFWRFLRDSLPEDHKWLMHVADILNLVITQQRYNTGMAYVVATPQELKSPALLNAKHVYTVTSFIDKIRQVDLLKSNEGLAASGTRPP